MMAPEGGIPDRVVPGPGVWTVIGKTEITVNIRIFGRRRGIIHAFPSIFDGVTGATGKQDQDQYGGKSSHYGYKNSISVVNTG
jgi:hypothetical protein